MMARFDRNVLRPRSPLLLPQQVLLVVVVVLAGMAVRTGANVECYDYGDGDYCLGETDGKCPVPEMNAAFAGKLTKCDSDGSVSRACVCARGVCSVRWSTKSLSLPPAHIICFFPSSFFFADVAV